jgi:sugar phosphate isomerase/epimerase
MIKLGCLVDRAIRQRDRDHTDLVEIEEFVAFASELRLDVIDFHLFEMSLDPDYLFQLKLLCHKYGLPIGYIGRGGGLIGDIQPGRSTVESTNREVDAATIIGAPMVRLCPGGPPAGRAPDGSVVESLWVQMIDRLKEVSDYAAEKSVIVGVQNHDSGGPIATPPDVLRMLRDVNRENFTYIMDAGQWMGSPGGNPIGETDPDVDIYGYMSEVVSHATCVRAKFYKIGGGREEWIDYSRVFPILKKAGFNGNISMVFELTKSHEGSTPEAVRMAVGHLRDLLGQDSP